MKTAVVMDTEIRETRSKDSVKMEGRMLEW